MLPAMLHTLASVVPHDPQEPAMDGQQSALSRPLIGLTSDVEAPEGKPYRLVLSSNYTAAVIRAGGCPVLLAPEVACIPHYLQSLDGIIMTGGGDIDVREAGLQLHAQADLMATQRQTFETALLKALDAEQQMPVLGICLGMQMMGVHKAGMKALVQHLGDDLPTAEEHRRDHQHTLCTTPAWSKSVLGAIAQPEKSKVASNHHQALREGGTLRVLATSHDGVIEAYDDPGRPFYAGVQWHPERTADEALGQQVINLLVEAARKRMVARSR
jgi:putative glutamine amidotransferase